MVPGVNGNVAATTGSSMSRVSINDDTASIPLLPLLGQPHDVSAAVSGLGHAAGGSRSVSSPGLWTTSQVLALHFSYSVSM